MEAYAINNGTSIHFPPHHEPIAMDAERLALAAWRDKTRDLKQAMMQALLTGRICLV